jgi:nicotinamidase-related amidase
MSDIRRALIVIDVQNEYFEGPLEIQYPLREDALGNIGAAIDLAQVEGMPVTFVKHTMGEGSPVFDPSTERFELHSDVENRRKENTHDVVKQYGSVYADTDVEKWLRDNDVDTVTLVGFMTNNCVIASAVEGEKLGFTTEVLSDATGAINLANSAGSVDAETVHTTMMALLNSNFAAVATTRKWADAVRDDAALERSNLVESALEGAKGAAK